jgi:hypothetical protein
MINLNCSSKNNLQIAEVASVGSGDVMSVIDWDAVDDLITDVY